MVIFRSGSIKHKRMLNDDEIDFIRNKENFVAKKMATDKTFQMFELLRGEYEALGVLGLFEEEGDVKITRGENHFGFPYLLMDGPGVYSKEVVFAFRVFVWFGHGVFLSLLLSDERAVMLEYARKIGAGIEYIVGEWERVMVGSLWDYRDGVVLARENMSDVLGAMIERGSGSLRRCYSLDILRSGEKVRFELQKFINLAKRIELI